MSDASVLPSNPDESYSELQEEEATLTKDQLTERPMPACPQHNTRNVKLVGGKIYHCNPFNHNFRV
jgi:hypothetical protein